jgi:hypothetical protein
MNAMGTTEVAKFDPNSYVDKVREKIKLSLIEIIPDEQWNAMLKTEIAAFFENKVEQVSAYYSSTKPRLIPSEFRQLVLGMLETETKRRVIEILATPEWSGYWDGTRMNVGEELARLARENGAAILSKWLEAAIAQVVGGIRFTGTTP